MSILFELNGNEAIFDMKEFCRLKDELTYVGQFAKNETSQVIRGTIIQYKGKFYTTEIPGRSGVCSYPADQEGLVTTSVQLFETDYVPEECKPLENCPIRIDIWNVDIDDEAPISSYAFYDNQLEEAKKVVKNNDVDIFVDGVEFAITDFLELNSIR